MSRPSTTASIEPFRFEPSVFGAMRRYRTMVLAIAALATAAAIGYSLMQPKIYTAQASLTLPQQASLPGQVASGQALDSQVLLLQSQAVARRAADIADSALGSNRLADRDFSGPSSSLTITPPMATTAGVYGASIIAISFTGPSARIAEIGLNAVLQAYRAAVSATIKAQGAATTAGIDRAIDRTNRQLALINRQLAITNNTATPAVGPSVNPEGLSRDALRSERQLLLAQRSNLLTQRAEALVSEQTGLAQQPTTSVQPASLAHGKLVRVGAIGFVIGIMLGGALAYARASREGLRRRDDIARALGAPVRLSVGRVRLSRWWPGRRGLAAANSTNVRRIVAYLDSAIPARSRDVTALAVIPVDDPQVAALSLVSLAKACAERGMRVVVADLASGAPAGGLLGVKKPGVDMAIVSSARLVIAIPEPDDVAPVGPLDRRSPRARGPLYEAIAAACATPDLLLTLSPLDPAVGGEHLATWATDAVAVITAGRSSWTRIHAVSEIARLVGTRLGSAVVVGADETDESLGVPYPPEDGQDADVAGNGQDADVAGNGQDAETAGGGQDAGAAGSRRAGYTSRRYSVSQPWSSVRSSSSRRP
jgi:hypothetical protein